MPRRLQTLNNEHLSFIMFKIGGYQHAEIAKILGRSTVTMKAWSKDPHIREVMDQVKDEIGESARKYLHSLLPETLFTMADIMRNGTTERARLDAASRIMDKALPAELKTTISGDPNKPLLIELLKTGADLDAHSAMARATPEEKAEIAAGLEKLEQYANTGATEPA